jgi:hypothetical protein
MAHKLTHPDNQTFEKFIHRKYLKYWQINAEQHKGNEVQTGRTMFKIIDIKPETNSREYENCVTITIEYDPNFLGHLFMILLNIGYREGYNDGREVYDIKPKTNKTNEAAY